MNELCRHMLLTVELADVMLVVIPAALIENNGTTEIINTGGRPVETVIVVVKICRRQT